MIEIGSIQEGKVTGIMNFGAFVSLPGGKSGLVHISEIAHTFVRDVHDHLQVGQLVRVKVLDISDEGKINLSLKQVEEEKPADSDGDALRAPAPSAPPARFRSPEMGEVAGPSGDASFEEKLKRFMQTSDSKNADKRRNTERKQHARRR